MLYEKILENRSFGCSGSSDCFKRMREKDIGIGKQGTGFMVFFTAIRIRRGMERRNIMMPCRKVIFLCAAEQIASIRMTPAVQFI